MRIRRKPWARPELAECPFCIDHPEELLGTLAAELCPKTAASSGTGMWQRRIYGTESSP